MNNIFILYPKRSPFGIWAFDDEQRGLVNEPFVGETNTLIDKMAIESGYDLKDNPQIALMFSHNPFPDIQCVLWLKEICPNGTTYKDMLSNLHPWLCPAFFLFYSEAPNTLYGAVVKKSDKTLMNNNDV